MDIDRKAAAPAADAPCSNRSISLAHGAYFICKIYLYVSFGNAQPTKPALCRQCRHTFVPYGALQAPLPAPFARRTGLVSSPAVVDTTQPIRRSRGVSPHKERDRPHSLLMYQSTCPIRSISAVMTSSINRKYITYRNAAPELDRASESLLLIILTSLVGLVSPSREVAALSTAPL